MEENIAQAILAKVNMIANQVDNIQNQVCDLQSKFGGMQSQMDGMQNQINGMQNQINGMQNQINGMQSQIDGMQNQINALDEKMERMNDNLMSEISGIKTKLNEVAIDASFAKNTCLTILEYLEKEERLTDEIHKTTKDHERRISIVVIRKAKFIPLV